MTDQLPGPDSAGFEQGFDVPGEDMSGVQSFGSNPPNDQLPFNTANEVGWLYGADMSGMASSDPIPQANQMGAASDSNMGAGGEVASSAGFHVIDSFDAMYGAPPGRQDANGPDMPGMPGVDVGVISNQGYPSAGAPGIDSMQGLDLAGGPPSIFGTPMEQDRADTGERGNTEYPSAPDQD